MARGEPIPIACTLTPHEVPGRLEEWAALRRESLRGSQRSGDTLTLRFDASAADRVRALVDSEQACCAFLRFTISSHAEEITVTISAPPEGAAVLDVLGVEA